MEKVENKLWGIYNTFNNSDEIESLEEYEIEMSEAERVGMVQTRWGCM